MTATATKANSVVIDAPRFRNAVRACRLAIGRLPPTTAVEISLDREGLAVRACNGFIEVLRFVPCDADEKRSPLVAIVPHAKLAEVVARANCETLRLVFSANKLEIVGNASRHQLFTEGDENTPHELECGDRAVAMSIRDAKAFAAALEAVSASSLGRHDENSRYAIKGVFVAPSGDDAPIQLVSTNGRQMNIATSPSLFAESGKFDRGVILPSGDAIEAIMDAADHDGDSKLLIDRSTATLERDDGSFTRCSLLEGAFPPYGDIVPKDATPLFDADAQDILAAFTEAETMSSEETSGVRVVVDGEAGTVKLSARLPEAGECEVDLPTTDVHHSLEFNLAPRILRNAMHKAAGPTTVHGTVHGIAWNKPFVFKVDGRIAVVMPVDPRK